MLKGGSLQSSSACLQPICSINDNLHWLNHEYHMLKQLCQHSYYQPFYFIKSLKCNKDYFNLNSWDTLVHYNSLPNDAKRNMRMSGYKHNLLQAQALVT
jgi:hypothetical protein